MNLLFQYCLRWHLNWVTRNILLDKNDSQFFCHAFACHDPYRSIRQWRQLIQALVRFSKDTTRVTRAIFQILIKITRFSDQLIRDFVDEYELHQINWTMRQQERFDNVLIEPHALRVFWMNNSRYKWQRTTESVFVDSASILATFAGRWLAWKSFFFLNKWFSILFLRNFVRIP